MTHVHSQALYKLAQRLVFILLLTIHCLGQSPEDIVLRGTLTRADHQHYRELPFAVPSGIHRITVEFSYTGREQHTVVDLGIWDGERFRGWSGGNKSTFTISETDATPSYLPGPLPPGQWKLVLGIPNLRESVTASFEAKIHLSASLETASFTRQVKPEARWYRGDLHMHDAHSDGSCKSRKGSKVPCPLFKTLEAADQRELDFIAVTDHNTTSHFDELRELAPYFDNLLFLHGREITTFQGHANVYGTDRFIDFRVGSPTVPDMNALLHEVQRAKGLISINHPAVSSGEQCMGCGWTPHPDADLTLVQAIEAVNGVDADTDRSGIPFWEHQLNRGFRLSAVGGSDSHNTEVNATQGRGTIGYPTTVVFARELSEPGILDGIRSGNLFIDVEGSRDRILEMSATSGDKSVTMGGSLSLAVGQTIRVNVHAAHVAGATLEIIEDGARRTDLSSIFSAEDDSKTFTIRVDGHRHWLRANVRSPHGKLLLVGNPIFLNS
jgi:hypothetical protein